MLSSNDFVPAKKTNIGYYLAGKRGVCPAGVGIVVVEVVGAVSCSRIAAETGEISLLLLLLLLYARDLVDDDDNDDDGDGDGEDCTMTTTTPPGAEETCFSEIFVFDVVVVVLVVTDWSRCLICSWVVANNQDR